MLQETLKRNGGKRDGDPQGSITGTFMLMSAGDGSHYSAETYEKACRHEVDFQLYVPQMVKKQRP